MRALRGNLQVMPDVPEPTRFRLVERIEDAPGRSVFLAHDARQCARVQVVSLRERLGEAEALRFGREARVLAGLRHAYIAGVLDHGVSGDGSPYFVREDEGGTSLAQRVAAGPLAIDEVWQIGLQIAEALICLHEHGLQHGAVTAENIRWSEAGVARLLAAPRTDAGKVDVRSSARADLRDLGRTLLGLLSRGEDGVGDGEPAPEPLRRVLQRAIDAKGHPDLRADELRAAWLEAGAQVWPHRLASAQPLVRPEPEVWPPAPDLSPAPPIQPLCRETGNTACSASTPPRLFARRLELRTLLGTGKCGQTWRAYHHILGRDVAVKILPRTLARTPVLADLCREAMALDKLGHRAFPRIYECDFVDDGSWYLVEEFIDGEPLSRTIQRGAMEPLAAVELVLELAEALGEAHSRGILHGDISFNNLMLERSLPPRPRIIDLSECRFLDAFYAATDQRYALTPRHRGDEGRAFGHPSFAAPELFRGGQKTERCDVYSLGAVLFMLLTGAQMPNAVLRELLADEPEEGAERLREYLVRAAPELEDTFLAGEFAAIVAPDPEQRVPSMAALIEVLQSERDALRTLRSGGQSTSGRPRATAPAAASGVYGAKAMSPEAAPKRRPGRAGLLWGAAALAMPLVAGGLWLYLSSRTDPRPTDPPARTASVPASIAGPARPQEPGSPTREEVRAALEGLAPRLRACPGAPRRLPLALWVGGPTTLIEINHGPVDKQQALDGCVRKVVEALRFEGAPVFYAVTVELEPA